MSAIDAQDVIQDEAGADTLSVTISNSGAVDPAATLAFGIVDGVETLSVNNASKSGDVLTIDMEAVTGLKTIDIRNQGDGRTLAFENLQALTTLTAAGSGNITMDYAATVTTSNSDVQKITLNGTKAVSGASVGGLITVSAGIETAAVTFAKASNNVITGADLTKITVDGAGGGTLLVNSADVTSVDASKATGNLVLIAANIAATAAVKGGSGNDVIALVEDLTSDITIVGGAGTDTLSVSNDIFDTDAFANVSGVEAIILSADGNVVLDLAEVEGVGTVTAALTSASADGNPTGTLDVSNLTKGSTVTLLAGNLGAEDPADEDLFNLDNYDAVTLTVLGADKATSTSDSLTIALNNNANFGGIKNTATDGAANNRFVVDSITVADVETVTISSSGTFGGNEIVLLNVQDAELIKVTGSNAITIGGIDTVGTNAVTFDASGASGGVSVTVAGAEAAAFEGGFKGGAGFDVLTVVLDLNDDAAPISTGFEFGVVLVTDNSSYDFGSQAGLVGKVVVGLNPLADFAVSGLTNGDTVAVQGAFDALGITGAGNTSALTLAFNGDNANFIAGAVTVDRVKTLTLNTSASDSSSDGNTAVVEKEVTFTSLDAASLVTLNIAGKGLSADLGTVAADKLEVIDASTFRGDLTLAIDMDGSVSTAVEIKLAALPDTSLADLTFDVQDDVVETVVFSSSLRGDVEITNFDVDDTGGLQDPVDVLNLSALGVKLSDLVFTDNNGDLEITSSKFAGTITLIDVLAADLSSNNFVFA